MRVETLHFENARVVQQLLGNEPKHLTLFQELMGVSATSRDGWVKLEGEDEAVEQAMSFFAFLEDGVKSGAPVRAKEFANLIKVAAEDGVESLKALYNLRIVTSSRKPPVVPKTLGQRKYVETIRSHDVTFGVGPAGTGKTYLAMAMAVSALKEGVVGRIILTRPAVEAGEAVGFLPGDLQEKLDPYLRPLFDALHDMMPAEALQKHMEQGVVEVAPLAYMRGRTLNNSFIILDESQNTTAEQMFMFLTRLGYNSRAVVTGDPTQTDLPAHKKSGLVEAVTALRDVEGIGFIEFEKRDVVRHPLVQRIVAAYEGHRGKNALQ